METDCEAQASAQVAARIQEKNQLHVVNVTAIKAAKAKVDGLVLAAWETVLLLEREKTKLRS